MFDEFGPRGAEDEREGFWTDLSEVSDEQYASSPLIRPRPPSPTGEGTYIYTF